MLMEDLETKEKEKEKAMKEIDEMENKSGSGEDEWRWWQWQQRRQETGLGIFQKMESWKMKYMVLNLTADVMGERKNKEDKTHWAKSTGHHKQKVDK